jgi:hypothetical protein
VTREGEWSGKVKASEWRLIGGVAARQQRRMRWGGRRKMAGEARTSKDGRKNGEEGRKERWRRGG